MFTKRFQKRSTKKCRRNLKQVVFLIQSIVLSFAMSSIAFASNVNDLDVMKSLNLVKTLFFALISVGGFIYLGKAIADLSDALHAQDGASVKRAIWGVVGGALMAGVSTVVTFITAV